MSEWQDILRFLVGKQAETGENDAAFALRLSLSRPAWHMLRSGKMKPGRRALAGISRAFPELAPRVMTFLLSKNASILKPDASEVNS